MRHAIVLDATLIAQTFGITIYEVRMVVEAIVTYLSPAVHEIPYCLTMLDAYHYTLEFFAEGGYTRWDPRYYGYVSEPAQTLQAYSWLMSQIVPLLTFDAAPVSADLEITNHSYWTLYFTTNTQGVDHVRTATDTLIDHYHSII